jgi:SAM-dependent methyltransferase
MRREELFNRDGVYSAIVHHNLLMHHEATEMGAGILKSLFSGRPKNKPIKVLDLACGGLPISITDIMARVGVADFSYTGIDINPDQVALAKQFFQFSGNTCQANLLEANAWDLKTIELQAPFDIIFTGLNLHHGTPEELDYLMAQVFELLDPSGIFLNHDWYRPDTEIYVRRPSCNPRNGNECYRLVPQEKIEADASPYGKASMDSDSTNPQWRLIFIDGMTESYRNKTKDDQGAGTLKSHMMERDFPVSRQDLADILKRHGFCYKILDYDQSGLAIWPFMAMPIAFKDESVYLKALSAVR